jgi:hypothetical protein
MKTNRVLVTLALAAALGLALAGCDQSGGGGGKGGPTPANDVKEAWGDDVTVVNATTVKLARDVSIGGGSTSLSASETVLKAAGSSNSRSIPADVRLIVPRSRTLTVKTGGTLDTKGTLELEEKSGNTSGGAFVVEGGTVELSGPVEAKASAVIEIKGGTVTISAEVTAGESAKITIAAGKVEISSTITAGANAEINFAGGDITIKATAEIKASEDSKDAKPTITVAIEVKQEKGATIDKDNIGVTGEDKITVAAPSKPGGGGTTAGGGGTTAGGGGTTAGGGGTTTGGGGTTAGGGTTTPGGGGYTPPPPVYYPPALQGNPVVSYDTDNNCAITVTYTFNMNVTVIAVSNGWTLNGSGTAVITAAPNSTIPGQASTITLTAGNPKDTGKTVTVNPVTVMPVTAEFSRPTVATAYTVGYFDNNGAAGLINGSTSWYLVTDANLKKIFNAIYIPNVPGTTDTVEQGKTAIAYDDAISRAALSLFTVTVGSSSSGDKIEIKGTALPAKGLASPPASDTNIIVIDIGIPDDAATNSGLKFYIPDRQLGLNGSGGYDHIRFRVNRGAETVILADNTSYIASGAGHPCPAGNFNNGCVEVMAGGKLRDGAYEGFPLGSDAVILSRLGSYLAVGPEPGTLDATGSKAEAYGLYYSGWLIGPDEDPRIQWDGGDQNGDYIEVRQGKLAISVNVTVRKTLGLIYSVWFANGPRVSIDARNDSTAIGGKKGLFANGPAYKFYGTKSASGGENIGSPTATIVIKPGSTLHKLFLTDGVGDADSYITASSTDITIENAGYGNGTVSETPYTNNIRGYLNWNTP